MNNVGTVTLETERLILRQFRLEDAHDMYHNWAGDPSVSKFLTWPVHTGIEASQAVIQMWMAKYQDLDNYNWCIELKSIGQAIGSITAVKVKEEISAVSIGYCIGRVYWGQGITTEALSALMDFFFDRVQVNRVEAIHDPMNPASGKVMEKCGLLKEGVQRQAILTNRGVTDAVLYGLVQADRSGKR